LVLERFGDIRGGDIGDFLKFRRNGEGGNWKRIWGVELGNTGKGGQQIARWGEDITAVRGVTPPFYLKKGGRKKISWGGRVIPCGKKIVAHLYIIYPPLS